MEQRHYKLRTYAVGERLLELRNRTGLTQAELGQLIGVSKRSILKWEGGEGVPNWSISVTCLQCLRHAVHSWRGRSAPRRRSCGSRWLGEPSM